MTTDSNIPTDQFDPKDDSVKAHLYEEFGRLRRECPVHYNPGLDEYVVVNHRDVVDIITDPDTFRNFKAQAFNPMAEIPMLPTADEPEHSRQRRLVARAFTPGAINRLSDYIDATANEKIDAFIDQGHCNIMTEFCYPLPMHVLGRMFGISHDDADFRHWANEIMMISTDPENNMETAMTAFLEFTDFILEKGEARRFAIEQSEDVPDDLLTALVSKNDQGEELTTQEFVVASAQLLVAGHESTTNMLGHGVYLLLSHPEQLQDLKDDPSLWDNATQEILRFEAPAQGAWRRTIEDVEIDGCPIPEEGRIYMLYGAANRDPDVFENPDEFNIHRPKSELKQHLSFGHGIHVCLGAHLARVEGRIALKTLFDRLANLRLDEDKPRTISKSHFMRGYRELHVTWDV